MKSPMGVKFLLLVAVILLLQIPLMMIQGQVNDRNRTRESVVSEISQSWGQAQNIVGPILVVPYTTTLEVDSWDKNLDRYVTKTTNLQHEKLLTPNQSFVKAYVDVTQRSRGIYTAPVYTTAININGVFDLSVLNEIDGKLGTPELVILMSDLSGVLSIPNMENGNETVTFQEGGYKTAKGIKVALPNWQETQSYDVDLELKGSQKVNFLPLAKNNVVSVTSNWLHPSFIGQFLPESYSIDQAGFSSNWRTTSLSSNVGQLLANCQQNHCSELMNSTFGVNFFEPVNHYTKSDRAVKYAILLIVTTFALFFVLETLQSVKVHPVQYFLVGLALTVFNLILVAMSEHISFGFSYLVSTIACVGLLAIYAKSALNSAKLWGCFMALLLVVYGFMYVILLSEDFAFLMGAVFLFIVLAVLMVATRKVNWEDVMRPVVKQPKPAE